jgi:hypothetical protein
MSLLDDVSIVVTPNAYKAGTLYGVIPVPTEGSEEITNYNLNGNFSDTSALHQWISGFGGSFAPSTGVNDGSIRITSSGGIRLNGLYMGVVVGKLYKVSVLASTNTGTALIECSGDLSNFTLQQTVTTTPTTFNFYVTYSSYISFIGTLTSNILTLDDISVKEWTSSDMDVTRATAATRVDENGLLNYAEVLGSELVNCGDFACADPAAAWNEGSGWSFSGGKAIYDGTGGTSGLIQSNVIEVGKQYKIIVEVLSNQGSGNNTIYLGGSVVSQSHLAVGTHTFYGVTSNTNVSIYIYGRSGEVFELGSFSVKEVDRDNVPRIDYTGGGCPHILAEPQRTNVVKYSESINSWTTGFSSLSPNAVTADYAQGPYSNTNADRVQLTINPANTVSQIYQFLPITSGLHTVSVWLKSLSGTPTISIIDGYNTVGSFKLVTLTNQWVRHTLTFTASASDFIPQFLLINGTTSSSADFLVYGFQVEAGSYPTSYIPTSTSAVTRNKDVFTRDGIASLINSTEGVLFAEMAALANDGTYRLISLSNGTVDNSINIQYSGVSNTIRTRVENGSIAQADISYTISNPKSFSKIAVLYKLNKFELWFNGSKVGEDTSGTPPLGLSKLALSRGDVLSPFFGKVKQLQVYKTALTDNQLIQLTGEAGTHFFESYTEMAEALTYTIQ